MYLFEKNLDLSELHEEHGSMFVIDLGLPLGGWNLAVSDGALARGILSAPEEQFYIAWPGMPCPHRSSLCL